MLVSDVFIYSEATEAVETSSRESMQHFEAFEKDIEEEVLGSIRKLAEMQCIKHHKAHHAWVDMIKAVELDFDVSFFYVGYF